MGKRSGFADNTNAACTRRTVIAGAFWGMGAGLLYPLRGLVYADPVIANQSRSPTRLQLAGYSIYFFSVGTFEMDVAQLFPNAEKALLENYKLTATKTLSFNICSLYVETKNNRIIIEPGGLEHTPERLSRALVQSGIQPDSIDSVFITHAHDDHYNGGISPDGRPAFKNATYYLHEKEWNHWENHAEKGDRHTTRFKDLLRPNKHVFKLIHSDAEVLPGVSTMLLPGHSPGHISVHLGDQFAYAGDVFLQAVHIERPEWVASWNAEPQEAVVQSRRRLLKRVLLDRAMVMGTHFQQPRQGYVERLGERYFWKPLALKNAPCDSLVKWGCVI